MAPTPPGIDTYRRSHKRIPTGMALDDDKDELKSKQRAANKMNTGAKVDSGPRKIPLSQWNSNVPVRGSGSIGQVPTPSLPDETRFNREEALEEAEGRRSAAEDMGTGRFGSRVDRTKMDARQAALARIDQGNNQRENLDEKKEEEEDLNAGIRDRLARLDDVDAANERIARQRAVAESSARAALGTGETGMSGAAALLEADAGRMAEQAARTAELGRELELAELESYLVGFDLEKERYDAAEQRQAAMAAYYIGSVYDMDYDSAMDFLGIPEGARTEAGRREYNEWHSEEWVEENESSVNPWDTVATMTYVEDIESLANDEEYDVIDETEEYIVVQGPDGSLYTNLKATDEQVVEGIKRGSWDTFDESYDSSSDVPNGYEEIYRDDVYIYYSNGDGSVVRAEITAEITLVSV
jgi:hypothetical protein